MIFNFDSASHKESIFKSQSEVTDYLDEYLSLKPTFEVGDHVSLNKFGEKKYRSPRNMQVARVIEVYQERRADKDGHLCDGAIAVCFEDGDIRTFMVDLRCYQQAKVVKGKNILSFMGRKK